MKFLVTILLLSFECISPLSIPNPVRTHPNSFTHWRLGFRPYSQFRVGYDSLPVHVIGVRGGGPKPEDRFKVEAIILKNQTAKRVNAVRLTWYLFNTVDLNVALDSRQGDSAKVNLRPMDRGDFEIFVVYANEIPLFKTMGSNDDLVLEVAVTEVQYDDGSVWQAKGLPQNIDSSRLPNQPNPRDSSN